MTGTAHTASSRKASAVFVSLVMVITACGSDNKSSSNATTGTTAASTPAPTAVVDTNATSASTPAAPSANPTGGSLIVGIDLPLQADPTSDTNLAIALLLEQQGGKAGEFDVTIKEYDSSTGDQCEANGNDHVANAAEVAVVGTFFSGCSKTEVPVLNADPTGPMLMISHANTNDGLTKPSEPGEPDKYYPTGIRNYARIIGTNDQQGKADAEFAAKELAVTKCVVLNDGEAYGVSIGQAFEKAASAVGITVVATEAWDRETGDYTTLFEGFKSLDPDCFFFAGEADGEDEHLIRDKVSVFGPNSGAVKLLAPDGFTGYESVQQLPEAEGMYISFVGLSLPDLVTLGGAAGDFVDAFQAKYGHEPSSAFALYGAAAMQFLLKAIAASDGTRKAIVEAAFSGIVIPESESLTGREFGVDANGDVTASDVSIQILTDGVETLVRDWPV
jgi:branched-chain amino acid transport system substrate-binding protein